MIILWLYYFQLHSLDISYFIVTWIIFSKISHLNFFAQLWTHLIFRIIKQSINAKKKIVFYSQVLNAIVKLGYEQAYWKKLPPHILSTLSLPLYMAAQSFRTSATSVVTLVSYKNWLSSPFFTWIFTMVDYVIYCPQTDKRNKKDWKL